MKTLNDLLVLGDPRLYEKCQDILPAEWEKLPTWVEDLNQVMKAFREKYSFGRAIAAPQIGIMKRLIHIHIDDPIILINPEILEKSQEMFEVWDDCMCFPLLYVKVKRHVFIKVKYRNEFGEEKIMEMKEDLSELFQHEYDHLEGILCTMRAIDSKSYKWRS